LQNKVKHRFQKVEIWSWIIDFTTSKIIKNSCRPIMDYGGTVA
jgi:hypothetical protein